MQNKSRYMQTTWSIDAQENFELPSRCISIRKFTENDLDKLITDIENRNEFSSHSWENDYYLEQVKSFSNNSIIELYRDGEPNDIIPKVKEEAIIFEKLLLLSSVFAKSRDCFKNKLSISLPRKERVDIAIGPKMKYIKTNTERKPEVKGIPFNQKSFDRFIKLGFNKLFDLCVVEERYPKKIKSAIDWVYQSRLEPQIHAAIVKTAIALETLLIQNRNEPLTRSLSERAAFLLSNNSEKRKSISKAIKKFYGKRSAAVHGGRKKSNFNSKLLEGADRVVLLITLVIAENDEVLKNTNNIVNWCNKMRWGNNDLNLIRPFSERYLNYALKHML